MARYFFHLRDGAERLLDPQGVDIGDPASLPAVALQQARALIAQDALQGEIYLSQRLEIEDAGGRIVHALRFGDAVRILDHRD